MWQHSGNVRVHLFIWDGDVVTRFCGQQVLNGMLKLRPVLCLIILDCDWHHHCTMNTQHVIRFYITSVAAWECLQPGTNVFVAAPTPAIRSPIDILMVTTMALVWTVNNTLSWGWIRPAMQTPIRQKRPNSRIPHFCPSKCCPFTVPPGADAPLVPFQPPLHHIW